jgi:hypothetical protein
MFECGLMRVSVPVQQVLCRGACAVAPYTAPTSHRHQPAPTIHSTHYPPAQHGLESLWQEAALDDEPLRAIQRPARAQLRQQEGLHRQAGGQVRRQKRR